MIDLIKFYLNLLFNRKIELSQLCTPLSSVNSSKKIAVLFFFDSAKMTYIQDYLPNFDLFYLKKNLYHLSIIKWIIQQNIEILVWGYRDQDKFGNLFPQSKNLSRVEDGFLRSKGLGKRGAPPLSLVIDSRGLYYNSHGESDIEFILNNHQFTNAEIHQAKKAINLFIFSGVSKYNHAPKISLETLIGKALKPRVLVIGQVKNDASLKYGGISRYNDYQLVKIAKQENPECEIIFKMHPDTAVIKGGQSDNLPEIHKLATVILEDIVPSSLFSNVDKVYTFTSLMGFEALIHGLPVVCVGSPFYSGWGLTDDRKKIERRKKKLTLEEIFYATYFLYPKYPYYDYYDLIEHLST